MQNKKLWFVIWAMVLVFGITAFGCKRSVPGPGATVTEDFRALIEIENGYTDWVDLGVISIPPTWSFNETEGPYNPSVLNISGDGVSETIRMSVWGIMLAFPERLLDNFSLQQVFTFADGRSGYMLEGCLLESDTLVIWTDLDFAVSLYYDGDYSVFTENEELILKVARTLRRL